MKFLNFGKIKKAWNNVKKFFAGESKPQVTKVPEPIQGFGHSLKHRGGWEKYNFKLIPLNNRKKPVIYRDFSKQKLPGSKIIIGKVLYNIVTN